MASSSTSQQNLFDIFENVFPHNDNTTTNNTNTTNTTTDNTDNTLYIIDNDQQQPQSPQQTTPTTPGQTTPPIKYKINSNKDNLIEQLKKNKFVKKAYDEIITLLKKTGDPILDNEFPKKTTKLDTETIKKLVKEHNENYNINDVQLNINNSNINDPQLYSLFDELKKIQISDPSDQSNNCSDTFNNIFKIITPPTNADYSNFESFKTTLGTPITGTNIGISTNLFDLMLSILKNLGIDNWLIFFILYGLNKFIKDINQKIIDKKFNNTNEDLQKINQAITRVNNIPNLDQNIRDILNNIVNQNNLNNNTAYINSLNQFIENIRNDNNNNKYLVDLNNIVNYFDMKNFSRITFITLTCDVVDEIYEMILSDLYLKGTIDNLVKQINDNDGQNNNELINEMDIYKKNMGELQLLSLLRSLHKIFIYKDKVTLDLLPFIKAINNKSKSLVNMFASRLDEEINSPPEVLNKYIKLSNTYNDEYYDKYMKYKTKYINLKNNI